MILLSNIYFFLQMKNSDYKILFMVDLFMRWYFISCFNYFYNIIHELYYYN